MRLFFYTSKAYRSSNPREFLIYLYDFGLLRFISSSAITKPRVNRMINTANPAPAINDWLCWKVLPMLGNQGIPYNKIRWISLLIIKLNWFGLERLKLIQVDLIVLYNFI